MPTTILINLQIAGCLDILVLYDTEVKNDGEKKKLSELICLEFKNFSIISSYLCIVFIDLRNSCMLF